MISIYRQDLFLDAKALILMKRGATSPPLTIKLLSEASREPLDLKDATATFKMFYTDELDNQIVVVNAAATIETDSGGVPIYPGVVSYHWTAPDVATPGYYSGFFTVLFDGGKLESFPQRGFLRIEIEGVP